LPTSNRAAHAVPLGLSSCIPGRRTGRRRGRRPGSLAGDFADVDPSGLHFMRLLRPAHRHAREGGDPRHVATTARPVVGPRLRGDDVE